MVATTAYKLAEMNIGTITHATNFRGYHRLGRRGEPSRRDRGMRKIQNILPSHQDQRPQQERTNLVFNKPKHQNGK